MTAGQKGWGGKGSLEVTWSNPPAPTGCPRAVCPGPCCTDILMWGNIVEELFENRKRINQFLLKACFAIKKTTTTNPQWGERPCRGDPVFRIKCQDGHHHISVDVINKIIAMPPPANKKETQTFLRVLGFLRMHILHYSQIVSSFYHQKNCFNSGPH